MKLDVAFEINNGRKESGENISNFSKKFQMKIPKNVCFVWLFCSAEHILSFAHSLSRIVTYINLNTDGCMCVACLYLN